MPKLNEAYDTLIKFYEALTDAQRKQLGILDERQLDNIIAKLKLARQASQEWGKVLGISAQQIAQAFAGAAANAFNKFMERVASGKNVFKALGQSVRELAANFLSSIAQMIIQLLAFAVAVQALRSLGISVPPNVFSVGQHHTGGIAGASAGGVRRSTAPALFANAMRFHTGGVVGLGPDEVPAILQRNEEVLTAGDPRHRANGGLKPSGDSGVAVKVVNLFDRDQLAEQLVSSKAGEKAILNILQRNPSVLRGLVR